MKFERYQPRTVEAVRLTDPADAHEFMTLLLGKNPRYTVCTDQDGTFTRIEVPPWSVRDGVPSIIRQNDVLVRGWKPYYDSPTCWIADKDFWLDWEPADRIGERI